MYLPGKVSVAVIGNDIVQHPKEQWEDLETPLTADRLAQLVERRTTMREVSGSNSRPDQHSGS